MTSFTPGPWKVASPYVSVKYTSRALFEIEKWTGVYGDEQEANARLIAAAPDLLAALENVMSWFGGMRRVMSEQGEAAEHDKLSTAARIAITKATV